MGILDAIKNKMKNESVLREEADRKKAEAAIREKPEYQRMIEQERMRAMLSRDKEKIGRFYSNQKKQPLAGTFAGGILSNMATAANKEFGEKSVVKNAGSGGGFLNPNPPMPDWLKKEKKKEG